MPRASYSVEYPSTPGAPYLPHFHALRLSEARKHAKEVSRRRPDLTYQDVAIYKFKTYEGFLFLEYAGPCR